MRASLELTRGRLALAVALAVALAPGFGCAKKPRASGQPGASAAMALPDLPEPAGVLGELSLAHPDATFRAMRELGRPWASLLPAGYPMLTATLLGLPPLAADSFDPDLPAVGLLVQLPSSEPGWVLALHAVSGPELVAKLSTGDHAPFRAVSTRVAGLTALEPSAPVPSGGAPSPFALAVFDNYLVIGASAELLLDAGPYAARMLPRRPPAPAPVALRFTQHALESSVVPALRALWAGYRTRLAHLDESDRSAHGGRAPDFADPAQVILGADAVVESLFSVIDDAAALELDLAPFPERLDATLTLEPQPGSAVQGRLAGLAPGTAQGLLTLPAETELALGLTRTSEDREAAGKAAGDDWARLLGARLGEHDAQQLRAALADWELGRGLETRYGFLGGADAGAFLVADVADAARAKRAGSGLLGLLALPGVRAPLTEFVGQPRVSEGGAVPGALPNVTRKQLAFAPSPARKVAVPPLTFTWLVEEKTAFAAASKNADGTLSAVVHSARGEHPTLAAQPGLVAAVTRAGDQNALFAYLDARLVLGAAGAAGAEPAPLLMAIGKHGSGAALRLEIAKPAFDLVLRSAVGQ